LSYPVALACAAILASLWAAPGLDGAAGACLACLMLAIAVSDWRRYRVPDRLNALALALRGLDIAISPDGPRGEAALDALARAVVTFAAFYLFRAVYGWARGREGLGLGDVKLAGVAGAWVDWRLLPWIVEAAALFGLALALARGRRFGLKADSRLPFAVGLAPAIWLGWWLARLGF
jgi:leader peptidase (prepilin peptidase)/N-methyltransferase